jgi:hypothetical protein
MTSVLRHFVAVTVFFTCFGAHAQDQSFDAEDFRMNVDALTAPNAIELGENYDPYLGVVTLTNEELVLVGIGPDIRLSRRFKIGQRDETARLQGQFGNWYLSVPSVHTWIAATGTNVVDREWVVARLGSADRYSRCSKFNEPPGNREESAKHWWEGVTLTDEHFNAELILSRVPESMYPVPSITAAGLPSTYPLLTKSGWVLGCLATTSNGVAGEAFMGISPDGNRYWFNHMIYKGGYPAPSVSYDGRSYTTSRSRAYLSVTRVEDRFGNYVAYSYGQHGLSGIVASDGRAVSIEWNSDGRISKIVANPGAEQRVFEYAYVANEEGATGVLSQVTRPDGSQWKYTTPLWSYSKTRNPWKDDCSGSILFPSANDATTPMLAEAPSGMTATYEYRVVGRGRSFVTASGACTTQNKYLVPRSLVRKTYSGPGLNHSWAYSYEVNASTSTQCSAPGAACRDYTRTTILNPDQTSEIIYVNNKHLSRIEGQVVRVESRNANSGTLSDETYEYANSDADLISYKVGKLYYGMKLDSGSAESNVPLRKQSQTISGSKLTYEVLSFDQMARPVQVRKYSQPSP